MSTYTIPQGANTVHAGKTVPMDWISGMILDEYFDRTVNNCDLSPQQLLQIASMSSTPAGSDLLARAIIRDLGFTGLTEEFIKESAGRIAQSAADSIEEIKELL